MHEAHKILRLPVDDDFALRCSCSCGWRGPTRHIADPHVVGLLADDEDWHDETIAAR